MKPEEEALKVKDILNWKLDMKEIIAKARKGVAKLSDVSGVNLTHLNSDKCQLSSKYAAHVNYTYHFSI
jgi:hypothetical protein